MQRLKDKLLGAVGGALLCVGLFMSLFTALADVVYAIHAPTRRRVISRIKHTPQLKPLELT